MKWWRPPMEDDLKILKVEYLSNLLLDLTHILGILKMKTTSNGRRPQNIKRGISQQPCIWSYSNFKLKIRWPNLILQILKIKTTSNGRWRGAKMTSKLVECDLFLYKLGSIISQNFGRHNGSRTNYTRHIITFCHPGVRLKTGNR